MLYSICCMDSREKEGVWVWIYDENEFTIQKNDEVSSAFPLRCFVPVSHIFCFWCFRNWCVCNWIPRFDFVWIVLSILPSLFSRLVMRNHLHLWWLQYVFGLLDSICYKVSVFSLWRRIYPHVWESQLPICLWQGDIVDDGLGLISWWWLISFKLDFQKEGWDSKYALLEWTQMVAGIMSIYNPRCRKICLSLM